MKKFILTILFILFSQASLGKVYAQGSNEITCDKVWEIVGSEGCKDWIVNSDRGGVWCNVPLSQEGLSQYWNNYSPKYTFTPGNCMDWEKSIPSQPDQTGEMTKQKPNRDGNPFNIFAFNPLETWRNIQGFLNLSDSLESLATTGEFVFGIPKEMPKNLIPEPSIATDNQGRPWDFLPGFIPHQSIEPDSTIRITERTRLSDKENENFFELRPGQSNQAVLKIPGKNEKELPFLEDGDVEVVKIKSGASDSSYDGIKTPNGTVISVQTHYLVSYNKKKNQTTVVVYEGKVEVKTSDGKTTTVSPNGDKPGVVVVSQKLSSVKLGILVLVIAGTVGGVIWLIKRKFLLKPSKKR